MAQNFRQQQDANRKKLRILLAVFFSFTAAAGRFAGSGFERLRDPLGMDPAFGEPARPPYRDYRYLMTATALLLGVAHMKRLRRCGDRVILGFARARPLRDRRFENVADEMAIAAALPTPRLWIVEDASLNAFAIGWDEHRSSIAITRGLLEHLDRDELQAVLAHEMAHIRNGDAKLMTLLLGMTRAVQLLAAFALGPLGALWSFPADGAEEEPGPPAPASPSDSISLKTFLLLVVATPFIAIAFLALSVAVSLTLVAAFALVFLSMPVLAAAWTVSELVRDPADRRTEIVPGLDPRWTLLLVPCGLVLGPAILVVGVVAPLSLLVFRLAISRNQELDADAGAVELTRNPAGLLSALRRLSRAAATSSTPSAPLPRMCLAPPRESRDSTGLWGRLFSTHPPIEERIRRVEMMTSSS